MPEDRNYEEEAKRKLDKWLEEHPISIDFEKVVEEHRKYIDEQFKSSVEDYCTDLIEEEKRWKGSPKQRRLDIKYTLNIMT